MNLKHLVITFRNTIVPEYMSGLLLHVLIQWLIPICTLKHFTGFSYSQSKQNRRIDHLLYALLKLSRDKAFERLIKTEKGKPTHRLCDIYRSHTAAESMKPDSLQEQSSDTCMESVFEFISSKVLHCEF